MSKTASPTALITGATDGIGYDTARRLAIAGWNIVLHATTPMSGEEAVIRLIRAGADPRKLEITVADFAYLSDVIAMAAQVMSTQPRLDVLINNATIAGPERRTVTGDGHELTFQVNYLAPYILTRLLQKKLESAPHARVVNVSSSLHVTVNLDWADIQRKHHYCPQTAYVQSKLALSMFTVALAATGQQAISINPGIPVTKRLALCNQPGISADEPGAVIAHFASPQTEIVNGACYEGYEVTRPAFLVTDLRSVQRLWRTSAILTGLVHHPFLTPAA